MKQYLFISLFVLFSMQNAIAQNISVGGQSSHSNVIRSQQVEQIKDMIESINTKNTAILNDYESEIIALETKLSTLTPNACPSNQKLHWDGDRWVCLEDKPCEPRDCRLRTTAVPQYTSYAWHADNWSTCSTTGTQSRIVTCIDSKGSVTRDNNCLESNTKPVSNQSCKIATILCEGKAISSGENAYCHLSNQTSVTLTSGTCSTSSSEIETYTLDISAPNTCSYICSETGDWLRKENNCKGL